MSHKFEKRCEVWQNEIRDGSVLAHVTKRIAAITPPRGLVVLRFLLNNSQNTLCIRPKLTTCSHPNSYTRSAETGEIFGLGPGALGAGQDPKSPPNHHRILETEHLVCNLIVMGLRPGIGETGGLGEGFFAVVEKMIAQGAVSP